MTAYRWQSQFAAERLVGQAERPRQGRPPRYTEADRAHLIGTLRSEAPPAGSMHRTVRNLARRTGMSRDTVHHILRAERLAPHRVKSWLSSTAPKLEAKALDIADIPGLRTVLLPKDSGLVLTSCWRATANDEPAA